jgi:hypothetical protein
MSFINLLTIYAQTTQWEREGTLIQPSHWSKMGTMPTNGSISQERDTNPAFPLVQDGNNADQREHLAPDSERIAGRAPWHTDPGTSL